jgi:hypothetical protein
MPQRGGGRLGCLSDGAWRTVAASCFQRTTRGDPASLLDHVLPVFSMSRMVPEKPHRSANRGKLFYRLAQQAVAVEPVTLDQILHPKKRQSWKCPSQNVRARETSFAPLMNRATGA